MEPEYIAVTVTVSVLGGVIIIALVIVCAVKASSDSKFKKSVARRQEHVDMMALQNALENPSYVHYPEPEPYTPTHPPEADPWRMSHIETPGDDKGPSYDTQDHARPRYDPSARPSIHHPYTGPPNGAPNMTRRPSYDQGMPQKRSYAQGLPRRQSQVEGMQRRASRVGPIERNKDRRNSILQNRRLSNVSQIPKLPTRRGSLQPTSEPPNGDKNKLWFFYLNETPNYFSREALERNKSQERVWSPANGGRPRSSASAYGPMRRESFAQPHPYTQPHPRRQSFSHTQPDPYPHKPDPLTHWI